MRRINIVRRRAQLRDQDGVIKFRRVHYDLSLLLYNVVVIVF